MTTLTPELLTLMDHEKGIEHNVGEIGWHLTAIRDGRLYLGANYATFDSYCLERWKWRRSYADRMIAANEVIQQLTAPRMTPMGVIAPVGIAPSSERQIRPLTPLRGDPDALEAAWGAAVHAAGGAQPSAAEVAVAARPFVRKREVAPGISHPAPYPAAVLETIAELVDGYHRVLDPFAGIGRIHSLADHETVGVELEPEWARMNPRTVVGDATALPYPAESFDAIATSPTYGNRMADHHDAYDPETRHTYRHDLGRELHPANTGAMQWGDDYRDLHRRAWAEAVRVLSPGGRFVLNIKDHIRDGRWQDVTGWHVGTLTRLGLEVAAVRPAPIAGRMDQDNAKRRAAAELVIAFDRPAHSPSGKRPPPNKAESSKRRARPG